MIGVVVAHPDDEILGCGASIARWRRASGEFPVPGGRETWGIGLPPGGRPSRHRSRQMPRPILLQRPLSLQGTVDEVLARCAPLAAEMIGELLAGRFVEHPQSSGGSFHTRADAIRATYKRLEEIGGYGD